MRRARIPLLGATLLVIACRDPSLQSAAGVLELQPTRVDFGSVFIGGSAEEKVLLRNSGRADEPISWESPSGPFAVDRLPAVSPAGAIELVIRFRPTETGEHHARLRGRSGETTISLELAGTGAEIPACPTPPACHASTFDLEQGRCVETVLADGTRCDAHSACVQEATCFQGRCVGKEKTCDDGNACTVDLCNAVSGCEHLPAPPCPGDGKCQVGVCDPRVGCTLAAADDGTLCGPSHTCDVADVCIAGSCVKRDPPDGFVCEPASPCQPEGRCVGSVCERPPAHALRPSWSFDSLAVMPEPVELHDFVLEQDGSLSIMGFFAVPMIRANTASSQLAASEARRCMLWNGRLICADYPFVSTGRVSAIAPATGEMVWTFDLPTARPDFEALAGKGRVFMARLATLGSDRLAALFEAFPAGTSSGTQCRLYFLVLLDAGGGLVAATQLEDPLLEVCNHPHPFGFAANAEGDLFIAFSGSKPGQAPLHPESPTLLMAYSRDGVLRWKRTESFFGGELAVAGGLLLPERSPLPFSSADGSPVMLELPPPTGALGRAVVARDRVVAAPASGDQRLIGYEAGTGQVRWVHALPDGAIFTSDQLRLSAHRPHPSEPARTVALAFTAVNGAPHLLAVDPQDGSERWSCAIDHSGRSAPQLFEVANGTLALMDGASACGSCDPPFAESSGAFHTFAVPGLELAREPWVGAFGGPGHDHQEEPLYGAPPRPGQ